MRIYYFDAGNTRLKLWCCEAGALTAEHSVAHHGCPADTLSGLPTEFAAAPDAVCGASVLAPEQLQDFVGACAALWGQVPQLASSGSACGLVRNGYADPGRLGVDRWLALLGAYDGARGLPVCVVDCGTALTIDVMLSDGEHQGGYILPGLTLMADALQLRTGGVRFGRSARHATWPGRDTAAAVGHGALLAAVALIDRLAADYGAVVVLTGGDAADIRPHLRSAVEHEPYLLLRGLQRYFGDAGIS